MPRHQRIDDDGRLAGAVQGLLDGQHVRVAGRLLHEFDHRQERFERVVQQHVALGDGGEDVAATTQRHRQAGRERRKAQVRAIRQVAHRQQAVQVNRTVDAEQVDRLQADLRQQVVGHGLRAGVGHFQAHRIAVAAGLQLALHGAQQIVHFFLVHEQVAVAGDAELIAALDLHARKQLADVGMDHRRQEHELVLARLIVRQRDDARQRAGRLHHGIAAAPTERIRAGQRDDEIEALVEHLGERMGRIQPERAQHRRQFVLEELLHPGCLRGRPLAAGDEADALLGQRRQQRVVQDPVLDVDLLVHAGADGRQQLARAELVRPGLRGAECLQFLQAGHANLEKLVQVGAEDAQKAQPLEQRQAGIERLRQHAAIELQQAQFAIDVQIRTLQIDVVGHGHCCS